jgi:uncharacterized membrane protein YeiH
MRGTSAAAGLTEDDFWLFFLDAVGVGAFCVIGAKNGLRAGMHPVVCVSTKMTVEDL